MDRIAVEIWTDLVCPWCYIGKRRFEQAVAGSAHRDAVDVRWRSFELEPDAPCEPGLTIPERMQLDLGMSAARAREVAAQVTTLAAEVGLTYRLDRARPVNSFDAHRVMHLAEDRGVGAAVRVRLMAAYTGEGAHLGDPEELVRLATEAGLEADVARAMLAGDDYADRVRDDKDRARALGVTGVPFFVFQGRYGVAGAQPSAAFADVLDRVAVEALPTPVDAGAEVAR